MEFQVKYYTKHYQDQFCGHVQPNMPVWKNYRGITFLPTILNTILLQRIYELAEQHNVLPLEQFGFHPGHMPADAIFILTVLIQRACFTHGQLYCCFVDLKII